VDKQGPHHTRNKYNAAVLQAQPSRVRQAYPTTTSD